MFPVRAVTLGRVSMFLCLLYIEPAIVMAQTTRAETIEQQRAAKEADLHPYEPGRLEKLLLFAEEKDPVGRISPRNGFFVRYGYHQKPIGAGIGFGGGYRHDLFDRRARLETEAGITFRNYQQLLADFSFPALAHGYLEAGVEAAHRHQPQDDFYGIGPDSSEGARVNYRLDMTSAVGRAVVRPLPWFAAGVHAGRLDTSIGRGTDPAYPSIETRFLGASAPGIVNDGSFGYADAVATVDYRDQPANPRDGGFYTVTLASYRDLEATFYDFRRLDVRLQQFFPIFDKKRVVAVQGRLITSTARDGQQVPFYFQPTLGGSDTLRSVSDFRFRDNDVLYLNAEYRWEALTGLDLALFTDGGTVGPGTDSLRLDQFTYAYGVGFRFNTYKTMFLRLDVGTGGGEGVHVFVKFAKAF